MNKKNKFFKIVIAGDGGVGKTSFLNRLIHDNFDENSELTKGVDFFSKTRMINGNEYNFILWDFAGQHQFKQLLNDFFDGSIAAYILFDLTRFNTLENIESWIKQLNDCGKMFTFILGTKSDIIDLSDCKMFDDHISDIRMKNNNIIDYLKISSKTGYNVKKAFDILLKKIS
ncbi:hypothetical protein LCGC14_0868680 [marine sediment metagenome]|uniref:Roc domain-containing protein n=1 Tax=marine sediment metagenome TaxID=412755 RepID=A0A0F9SCD0_9ZZZZ